MGVSLLLVGILLLVGLLLVGCNSISNYIESFTYYISIKKCGDNSST